MQDPAVADDSHAGGALQAASSLPRVPGEDPVPAGPSEAYETGPSLDVVGGPGSDEEFLPYTESSPYQVAQATKTAPDPFLPFTGANSAVALALIGVSGASGLALRRVASRL